MAKVELWKNTGFNSIDIPCGPQLLYTDELMSSQFYMGAWDDINLIQDMWESVVILDDITPEDARCIDYCIITDDETDKQTCYTVKNFTMVSPNSCRLNLFLDPYNTMGGFEYGTGNVVIAGSANRLTVPMQNHPAIYPKAEDNTFFTLEEPFRPSNRIKMNYTQPVPQPTPLPDPEVIGGIYWGELNGVGLNINKESLTVKYKFTWLNERLLNPGVITDEYFGLGYVNANSYKLNPNVAGHAHIFDEGNVAWIHQFGTEGLPEINRVYTKNITLPKNTDFTGQYLGFFNTDVLILDGDSDWYDLEIYPDSVTLSADKKTMYLDISINTDRGVFDFVRLEVQCFI